MVVSVCRLLGEVHRQRRQTHHHHHRPQPHHSENTNAMKINLKPYETNQNKLKFADKMEILAF